MNKLLLYRYLDLRIAVHKPRGALQFVHGMYAEEITQPFVEIKQFLLNHPHEVVVLDLQHFYDFTAHDHKHLQVVHAFIKCLRRPFSLCAS